MRRAQNKVALWKSRLVLDHIPFLENFGGVTQRPITLSDAPIAVNNGGCREDRPLLLRVLAHQVETSFVRGMGRPETCICGAHLDFAI